MSGLHGSADRIGAAAPVPIAEARLPTSQTTSTRATRWSRAASWAPRACRRSLDTIGCAPGPGSPPPPPAAASRCLAASAHPGASTFNPRQAYIVLDLKADLRSEFSWNTKQLFVYVGVAFGTRKNRRNDMVLWSTIIEDKVREPLARSTGCQCVAVHTRRLARSAAAAAAVRRRSAAC